MADASDDIPHTKPPKETSSEYLKEILDAAKKLLPGWMFAQLHQLAFPRAGGKARSNKRKAEAAAKMLGGAIKVEDLTKADIVGTAEAITSLGLTVPDVLARKYMTVHKADEPAPADDIAERLMKGERLEPQPVVMEVVALLDTHDELVAEFDASDVVHTISCSGVLALEEGDRVEVTDGRVTGVSKRLFPDRAEDAERTTRRNELIAKMAQRVPIAGPPTARLIFVTAAPNELEAARAEPLVGQDGVTFQDLYLSPLGLTKSDVAVGFLSPHWIPDQVDVSKVAPWLSMLRKELRRYPNAKVIALGKVAKAVLGELAVVSMPHPSAVRKRGDAGEIERKLRHVGKLLDAGDVSADTQGTKLPDSSQGPGANLTDANGEPGGARRISVTKSADEKQIVYGVVLDPYIVDTHDDWIPPEEIEQTAHGYLAQSRVVGFEHREKAEAQVVESWVVEYPSQGDREAAFKGLPHKAFRRRFGADTVASGTWLLGVKLSDELWNDYKRGDINGFSIGGFSQKLPTNTSAMPDVTWIDQV